MPKVAIVIPARMASTRFPGKPLEKILGISMIQHIYSRVQMCRNVSSIVIATCDKEIINASKKFGAQAVLTSKKHKRSVDRVAEAVKKIDCDIVINLQGDEPLVTPEIIDKLITVMIEEKEIYCANLVTKIGENQFNDTNTVKIVHDINNNIIYFSREPIPSKSKFSNTQFIKYKQIGIMAFTKEFLIRYNNLTPTPLEEIESVDMLRVVEHGYKIKMVNVEYDGLGVDIPKDINRVEKLMKKDNLLSKYYIK